MYGPGKNAAIDATFIIVVAEGYRIKSVTVNEKSVFINTDGTYTIESVTEDIVFNIVSEVIPTFDDSVSSGDNTENKGCNGSISSLGFITALCAIALGKILLKKKKD